MTSSIAITRGTNPVVGSRPIADSWVEADRKDAPDSWEAQYTCIAVDGDVAVATGYSKYLTPDGETQTIYDNCFVMRFAEDGRCASFTEFFMERPTSQRK